jgi:hypothetical protein
MDAPRQLQSLSELHELFVELDPFLEDEIVGVAKRVSHRSGTGQSRCPG